MIKHGVLLGAIYALCGCSTGPCNNVPREHASSEKPVSTATATLEHPAVGLENPNVDSVDGGFINVFKKTGERQCGTQSATPIEDVKKQLLMLKIPVSHFATQSDGLMHMQVCGAPTDKIYVFEIASKYSKKALGAGFRLWTGKLEKGE